MNVFPPPIAAPSGNAPGSPCTAAKRWDALADAGDVVAQLAGCEPGHDVPQARDLQALLRNADPWRRERAECGIDDIAAVMEPGLAALLAVNARGADPRPAAAALWREFAAARAALLALLPATPADAQEGA